LTIVPTSDACRACEECSLELLLQCTLSGPLFWAYCSRCTTGSPAPCLSLQLLPYKLNLSLFDVTTLKEAHNLSALLRGGVLVNHPKGYGNCCHFLRARAYSGCPERFPLLS
jgi:hypothetical protein